LKEPHDFRAYGMDCRSCHKSIGIKKSGGLVKPVRAICYGCHALEGLLSHPVDIKPGSPLPVDLPLDEKGMMTCSTCHDPHKSYKNQMTGKKTMYLRREGPPKVFCMACHSKV
jgi:predicted CXXCH cytochrome family protein